MILNIWTPLSTSSWVFKLFPIQVSARSTPYGPSLWEISTICFFLSFHKMLFCKQGVGIHLWENTDQKWGIYAEVLKFLHGCISQETTVSIPLNKVEVMVAIKGDPLPDFGGINKKQNKHKPSRAECLCWIKDPILSRFIALIEPCLWGGCCRRARIGARNRG